MVAQLSTRDLYTARAGAYHRFVAAVRHAQRLRAAFREFEPLCSDMKTLDADFGSGWPKMACCRSSSGGATS